MAKRVERLVSARRLILMYHRVDVGGTDPGGLAVAPIEFDSQIDELGSSGTILPLRELIDLGPARAGQSYFSITFDDGYSCNLHNAVPILERHDAPATIFIPTAFVGAPYFWWDRLAWAVLDSPTPVEAVTDWWLAEHPTRALGLDSNEPARPELLDALYRHLVQLPLPEIIESLDSMAASLRLPEFLPFARPVDREELARLASHPLIEIGAHTQSHRILPLLDRDECLDEIAGGKGDLDDLLGPGDRILAYPYGRCNRNITDLAGLAGFEYAVTTAGGHVSRFDPPRLVARAAVTTRPTGQSFESWLASVPA